MIVPVYNVEKYLRQCLDSLVYQTFHDFEIIVIDDGSTDLSGTICDEYAAAYDFLTVVHQENQGLSGARNRGLSEARGEWLVFVDSDDWVKTTMLERLSCYIASFHADFYRFNTKKTDEKGEPAGDLLFAVENILVPFDSDADKFQFLFHDFLQYKTGWEVWSGIYRRDLVQLHQLKFESTKTVFAEDLLFTFQYLLYAGNVAQVCDFFYYYRQRETSLINSALAESILPRVSALGESVYGTICRERMRYFKRNYYLLYFMLLNYHIMYKLCDTPDEKLCQILDELDRHRLHRRFMREIVSHKFELSQYLEERDWV